MIIYAALATLPVWLTFNTRINETLNVWNSPAAVLAA